MATQGKDTMALPVGHKPSQVAQGTGECLLSPSSDSTVAPAVRIQGLLLGSAPGAFSAPESGDWHREGDTGNSHHLGLQEWVVEELGLAWAGVQIFTR